MHARFNPLTLSPSLLFDADYYAALYVKTSIRGYLIRAKVTIPMGRACLP